METLTKTPEAILIDQFAVRLIAPIDFAEELEFLANEIRNEAIQGTLSEPAETIRDILIAIGHLHYGKYDGTRWGIGRTQRPSPILVTKLVLRTRGSRLSAPVGVDRASICAVMGGRVTPDSDGSNSSSLALEIRGLMLHNGDVQIDANITFLQVSDIERSRTFYAEGLGLTLVLDQGGCQIFRLTDTSYLGVCEKAEPASSKVIVTIVTEDVAGWHERFTAAEADTDGPPRDNLEYRIHHFFASDPDGHVIEIQRFWDTDWAESAT